MNSIGPEKWQHQFKSLLDPSASRNKDQQNSSYVNASHLMIENVAIENVVINGPICSTESIYWPASFKKGKALYHMDVPTDAIKCGIRAIYAL